MTDVHNEEEEINAIDILFVHAKLQHPVLKNEGSFEVPYTCILSND